MRNIYRISPARGPVTTVRALVVVALVLGGLGLRTQTGTDVMSHTLVAPASAQAQSAGSPAASASPIYFPAQYELHAGQPQPHVEAF